MKEIIILSQREVQRMQVLEQVMQGSALVEGSDGDDEDLLSSSEAVVRPDTGEKERRA